MLLVQEYLENKSFGDLAREHGVYCSLSKSGHKFSLNYDMIEARESDPLSQQCRGLILARQDGTIISSDSKDQTVPGKTVVLARAMDRFFNHGQGSCAPINWSDPNLAVLEKLDGTLCIVYYDPFLQQWYVATRSVPEADIPLDNGLFTFRTLFEKAVEDTCGYSFQTLTRHLYPQHTYCFELTTPYNHIVVKYPNNRITLLAVRDLITNLEVYPERCQVVQHGVPHVQTHTYTRLEELLDWVSSLNPSQNEGVVVRDSNFNRVKIKNAGYLALSKVRESLSHSERNCLEIILLEKDDDVLPLLPEEIANNLRTIKAGLQQVIRRYDDLYQQAIQKTYACSLCGKSTDKIDDNSTKCPQCGFTNTNLKKTFALSVAQDKSLWSAPFFHMFGGKSDSMKDFIMKSKKEGTWADGFLDKLLGLINNTNA